MTKMTGGLTRETDLVLRRASVLLRVKGWKMCAKVVAIVCCRGWMKRVALLARHVGSQSLLRALSLNAETNQQRLIRLDQQLDRHQESLQQVVERSGTVWPFVPPMSELVMYTNELPDELVEMRIR